MTAILSFVNGMVQAKREMDAEAAAQGIAAEASIINETFIQQQFQHQALLLL